MTSAGFDSIPSHMWCLEAFFLYIMTWQKTIHSDNSAKIHILVNGLLYEIYSRYLHTVLIATINSQQLKALGKESSDSIKELIRVWFKFVYCCIKTSACQIFFKQKYMV